MATLFSRLYLATAGPMQSVALTHVLIPRRLRGILENSGLGFTTAHKEARYLSEIMDRINVS